ncbi:MAG: zinc-ribbon domain-containing protein [Gemmataceae bacterium]|nr:zinc-ribbon domain-containing protein [Gemmataceae bacterium]
MPIIIWGSRGITSDLDHGDFHCPSCDCREEFTLKHTRPFFTFFFIPIFPIGGGDRYVECRGCRGTYKEEVLRYEPPTEGQRILGQLYEELRTGTSLQVMQGKMINQLSMDPDKAWGILEQMCEGKPRECSCGQRYHPDVRKCSRCGADL